MVRVYVIVVLYSSSSSAAAACPSVKHDCSHKLPPLGKMISGMYHSPMLNCWMLFSSKCSSDNSNVVEATSLNSVVTNGQQVSAAFIGVFSIYFAVIFWGLKSLICISFPHFPWLTPISVTTATFFFIKPILTSSVGG